MDQAPANTPQEEPPESLAIIGYICVFSRLGKKEFSFHREKELCLQACVKNHGVFHPAFAPIEAGVPVRKKEENL